MKNKKVKLPETEKDTIIILEQNNRKLQIQFDKSQKKVFAFENKTLKLENKTLKQEQEILRLKAKVKLNEMKPLICLDDMHNKTP